MNKSTHKIVTKRAKPVGQHMLPVGDEALDKATIAALSAALLDGLTRDELIRVICAAELPLISVQTAKRLRSLDRPTLLRLAHLASRSCRLQGY